MLGLGGGHAAFQITEQQQVKAERHEDDNEDDFGDAHLWEFSSEWGFG